MISVELVRSLVCIPRKRNTYAHLRPSAAGEDRQPPGLKDDSAPEAGETPAAAPVTEAPRIERVTIIERIAPREMEPVLVAQRGLVPQSRRDFLLYGAGAALAAAGFWWVLPEEVQQRLGGEGGADEPTQRSPARQVAQLR